VGAIFIWLSGASRKILAECPTEKPKYFGLGAAILVTGAMAAVSLAFALVNALKITTTSAVVFAVLWGLAIMMIDRLFVVTMHRQRNPWIYFFQAAPRVLMSVVLGFVISTPFVLQIFKPEITNKIQQMQAAEREAYFQGLPTNPVNLTVESDQAKVDQLAAEAKTGGPGINISTDPQLQSLQRQLTTANNEVSHWTAELHCELYGGKIDGLPCHPGYGPDGKNDQQQITTWQGQVNTLNAEVRARTGLLTQQSQSQQNGLKVTAQHQLTGATQALQAAQTQLTEQTQNVTSGIKQDTGILTQLKALSAVTAGNSTLQWARLLLFLLFLFIDIMPVFIKLMINLAPAGPYDKILADEEGMQLRDAENGRAVRQAVQRQAAQAEATGVRYRNDALSAPLPGMRDAILDSRLRVEQEWLRRREAEQMRDVAEGQGIAGVGGLPHSDGWYPSRPQGQSGGFRASEPWNDGASRTRRPGTHRAPASQASPAAGGWQGSPSAPDPLWYPDGQRTPEESWWTRLRSVRLPRLPRLGLWRPREEPVPQPGPDDWAPTQPSPNVRPLPADADDSPTRPEPVSGYNAPVADYSAAVPGAPDGGIRTQAPPEPGIGPRDGGEGGWIGS
jgi:hypothetical protein